MQIFALMKVARKVRTHDRNPAEENSVQGLAPGYPVDVHVDDHAMWTKTRCTKLIELKRVSSPEVFVDN